MPRSERLTALFVDSEAIGIGLTGQCHGEVTLSWLERSMPSTFAMFEVQPGMAKARPSRRIAELLLAANAYIVNAGHFELMVIETFAARR